MHRPQETGQCAVAHCCRHPLAMIASVVAVTTARCPPHACLDGGLSNGVADTNVAVRSLSEVGGYNYE
jgi:hypothetical protein